MATGPAVVASVGQECPQRAVSQAPRRVLWRERWVGASRAPEGGRQQDMTWLGSRKEIHTTGLCLGSLEPPSKVPQTGASNGQDETLSQPQKCRVRAPAGPGSPQAPGGGPPASPRGRWCRGPQGHSRVAAPSPSLLTRTTATLGQAT